MGKRKTATSKKARKLYTPITNVARIERGFYNTIKTLQASPMIWDISTLPVLETGEPMLVVHNFKYGIKASPPQEILILPPDAPYATRYNMALWFGHVAHKDKDSGKWITEPIDPDEWEQEMGADGQGGLFRIRKYYKPRQILGNLAMFFIGEFEQALRQDPEGVHEPIEYKKGDFLAALGYNPSDTNAYAVVHEALHMLDSVRTTRKVDGVLMNFGMIGGYDWPSQGKVKVWPDARGADFMLKELESLTLLKHFAQSAGYVKWPKAVTASTISLNVSDAAQALWLNLCEQPLQKPGGGYGYLYRTVETCYAWATLWASTDAKLRDKRRKFTAVLRELTRTGYIIGVTPTPDTLDKMKWRKFYGQMLRYKIFTSKAKVHTAIQKRIDAVKGEPGKTIGKGQNAG